MLGISCLQRRHYMRKLRDLMALLRHIIAFKMVKQEMLQYVTNAPEGTLN